MVKLGNTVVGHVPYNLVLLFSHFLAIEFNKGGVYVTGEKTNRGAGYGLEVPWIYRLYGLKAFVDRLKQKVESSRQGPLAKFNRSLKSELVLDIYLASRSSYSFVVVGMIVHIRREFCIGYLHCGGCQVSVIRSREVSAIRR